MKRLLALIGLAAALAVVAGLCGTSAARADGCELGGKTDTFEAGATKLTTRFCGPAVVTLKIGNKSEVFRNGSCFHANGGKGIIVAVGTWITFEGHTANPIYGGIPYVRMGLSPTKASALSAYFGNTTVDTPSATPVAIKISHYGTSGTFTGVNPRVSGAAAHEANHPAYSFTGTWSCNGPLLPGENIVGIMLSGLPPTKG